MKTSHLSSNLINLYFINELLADKWVKTRSEWESEEKEYEKSIVIGSSKSIRVAIGHTMENIYVINDAFKYLP
jgi:hypothetical protein